jgi:hypothetical protein
VPAALQIRGYKPMKDEGGAIFGEPLIAQAGGDSFILAPQGRCEPPIDGWERSTTSPPARYAAGS